MALIDRYEFRALVAAAIQIVVMVLVLAYGLWAPSLGLRLCLPTLAMLPAWAGLFWLILHSPWDWEGPWAWGGTESWPLFQRVRGYSEAAMVYGGILALCRCHLRMFGRAKEWAASLAERQLDPFGSILRADQAEAWASDTFGGLILSGEPHGWVFVGTAFFILGLVWFLLPR